MALAHGIHPLRGAALACAGIALLACAGCVGVLAGGAVTGASVAHDQRTAGTVLDDQATEMKAVRAVDADPALKETVHVNFTSYNLVLLVTGEAPTEELRQKVIGIAREQPRVRQVYDELVIAGPSTLTERSSDSLLTARVKTQLFTLKEFDATRVKVVTERGVVYLLGLLSRADADRATEIARSVGGVQKVVKLFEYVDG